MKICSYCGRENSDEAVYCRECTRNEFIQVVPQSPADKPMVISADRLEALPRDYPKRIVVVGIWVIFLPGFIASVAFLLRFLSGKFGGIQALVGAWLSLFCGLLSGYVLYRSARNYTIHKKRIAEEANE